MAHGGSCWMLGARNLGRAAGGERGSKSKWRRGFWFHRFWTHKKLIKFIQQIFLPKCLMPKRSIPRCRSPWSPSLADERSAGATAAQKER